jgi:hypothetical protein
VAHFVLIMALALLALRMMRSSCVMMIVCGGFGYRNGDDNRDSDLDRAVAADHDCALLHSLFLLSCPRVYV